LSDGEDHDSDVTATLKEAIDAGLKVVLMGVGTIEGGPLEDEEGKLRKSEDGQMITTTLNEKAMQDLAEKTGARYVRAGVDDDDLRKMMPYLKQSSKAEFSETKDRSREKSFWFALFGLVVLALQFLVGGRQGILGLLLLVGMSVNTAEASPIDLALHKSDWARSEELIKEQLKREPENTTLWYNLGVAQYQQKKYQDSSVSFSKASQGELAKAEALYNLGNAEAQNQNFDGAIAAYEDALRIKPDDQATRENLEYVKKLKDQKNQQQSNQQENNKDDQQSEPKESDPKNSEQKDSRTQDQQQENKDQQKQQPQQDSVKDPDTSDQGSSQAKKDLDRQLTPEEIDKKLKEMSASRTLDMVPEKNRVHKPEAARRAPGGKDW
jgi:Ca-activated chloride channel family protein